jgi:Dyp-type peroxidase family
MEIRPDAGSGDDLMTLERGKPVPTLELDDIQGNILAGYRLGRTRYHFVRFENSKGGRAFLDRIAGRITSATRWPIGPDGKKQRPESTLNVALTHPGLVTLDLPSRSLYSFPPEFQQGMRARSAEIHDTGRSDRARWEEPWRSGVVHALVTLYARDDTTRDAQTDRLLADMAASGGTNLVGQQDAAILIVDDHPSPKEHFGYTDGIGNPDIAGMVHTPRPGRGKLMPDGSWAPLAAGEFLLGHPDEAQEVPAAPLPMLLARNGTFQVYRKIHQNVGSFRRYLQESGERYPGGVELLAAKFVGRWRDGTPLELSPHAMDAAIATDRQRQNDFKYADDPDGLRCPVSSHIRRSNPRDANGFGGVITDRHRIIRRGVPYGPWVPLDQPSDDEGQHGLIFNAYCASLSRQFEFVQQQWINYGNDFNQGNDRDLLVGNHLTRDKMVIQGDTAKPKGLPPFVCFDPPTFVETRGGDYFFVPSLTALRQIASGTVEVH